jgi:hypothetical protein
MLVKLQRKTLVPAQITTYAITLLIGVIIILTTLQLFLDAKPLLFKDASIFSSNSAVISKKVNILKSLNKEGIYFSDNEINELRNQNFIEDISQFTSATFRIKARTDASMNVPMFTTDLFFESVAEKYLDVQPEEWIWDESLEFIPIIIPEDYLNLYNFGFAESQGLPVLSKNTISQLPFKIELIGNGNYQTFDSKIVGFSSKINSILVPQDFLVWANEKFGERSVQKTNRILVEFKDPSDEAILAYFKKKNYEINKESLEFSKLIFFFKSALLFVFIIAVIIIVLSIAFIMMSVNLILQKNKTLILNLYNIGYSTQRIAKFYQITISSITLISIVIAVILCTLIRGFYLEGFQNFFPVSSGSSQLWMYGIVLALSIVGIYNLLLIRNIKRIVIPKRNTSASD